MCGIGGYIDFNGSFLNSNQKYNFVSNASSLLVRRGPDSYGHSKWENDDLTIEFVHTRLSIIDLSVSANQPFFSRDGKIVLIFNGEIYNYVELKGQLKRNRYRTNSDTEILLEAYLEYGLDMFQYFEGMFAGAILDRRENKLHLFRDHMGIKPLYFHQTDDGILFSSEPKVIRNVKPSLNRVNNNQAATFLMFGLSDYSKDTFFTKISQLKPGHLLTVDLNSLTTTIKRFFDPAISTQIDFPGTPEGYYNLFSDVVKRQLRSDVQVGTSLSGGIDSGVIAFAAGKVQTDQQKIKALTYTAPGFANDESDFATQIANIAGLNWVPVQFSVEKFIDDFQALVNYMEEPFGSLSIFAQFNIMKAARQHGCKVMLDGQGGDELFIGYPRLAQRIILQYLMDLRFGRMLKEWYWAIHRQEMSLFYPILSNLYFNSYKFVKAKKLNYFSKYVDREYLSLFDEDAVMDFFSVKGITEKQVDELHKYILPRLLRYADRNSMFHSVESRVPHLAQRLVYFSLNLDPDQKIKNGWTKYIIRKAFQKDIPREVIWQTKKIGFDTPQGEWLAKVQPFIEAQLDSLGGIINTDVLMKDLKNPQKSNEHSLFRIFSFILSVNSLGLTID